MPPSAIRVERLRHEVELAAAQQELERRGGRELRRAPEAAPLRVELRAEPAHGVLEDGVGQRLGRRASLVLLAHGLDERLRLARHVVAPLAVRVGDRDEQLPEARQPVPRLGRVVRPAEERLALGRQEDRHRPAPVPAQRDDRVHVDGVDVGALLAVDLDVDEALVHHLGGLAVLERLVLHHVAPVARRVADREQDRLVLLARSGARLLTPRVPVDRVVGVLEEVRARLLREAVHTDTLRPAGRLWSAA